ncbi:hypothetical protein GPECTOR_53g139 [Gonium pectorale]|uniref:DUF2322 family protein n=1 Tax=Gonium pectorale TaxID=33097 RepID=A0A150G707_GONPE|nr:hypothetical protein GPECTOR_53g139 [Gonium pectorale]|eukprot:KXZ45553.1 hypothetical protein GPECTOR_53g139 [Gonium pectorale]
MYGGKLTKEAAQEGLRLYGEVVDIDEARRHPGSHPNIDLLLNALKDGKEHEVVVERS